MKEPKLFQNKNTADCPYHPKGVSKEFRGEQIYPYGICPWLYYSVYPYMLGLLYGANFKYNKMGDAWAMCPAKDGCRTIIRKRKHPGNFKDPRISLDNYFVIYAEVISVGACPAKHKVGQKFIFPTCMQKHYACPAAWYQAFPFMNNPVYKCLNRNAIRCPDWKCDVTLKIK